MIMLTIKTENAAFENQAGHEVARILRKLADQVEDWPGVNDFKLNARDMNGNTVGLFEAKS